MSGQKINSIYRRRLKARLSEAQNHRCCYCGVDVWGRATLEHVKPVSKGGKWTFANLVIACAPCNLKRGNKFVNLQ